MLDFSEPLSISALTREVKELVEANFPAVAVVGEISNFVRASSGHLYFTLKDQNAQLRGVMWRGSAARLKFDAHDGLEVIATGRLEVYPARGSYQLVVEQMQPQGMGGLELAFRQLQEKLEKEGLFDPEFKQPIPRFPRRIALVTSPTGAAVRDMLQVMTRRWPGLDVVLLPVAVQGDGAAEQIAASIDYAPRIPGVDLIITGRGGGSLEDLWAFNEEIVARSIFACPVPIISAVGHEIDVSISDLVADRRALTPSEAAELATPSRDEVVLGLKQLSRRVGYALQGRVERTRMELEHLRSRPVIAKPQQQLDALKQTLDEWTTDLTDSCRRNLERQQRNLAHAAEKLDALSPLGVLKRGYSLTLQTENQTVVRDAAQVAVGETLRTILKSGVLISEVREIQPASDSPEKSE